MVAYVVMHEKGYLYWYEGPSCEGWVDRRHEATWFDRYDAEQAARRVGGRVVGVSRY